MNDPTADHETPRTIFPDSSASKRAAIAAMRFCGRLTRSVREPLPPTHEPIRLLIQTIGGIGNTLMATPMIAQARRIYPNARIDVLTTRAASKLFANNPHATSIIPEPVGGADTVSLIRRIRATRYDAAIFAVNSHLAKYAANIVLGRIPRRVMHAYEFRPYDDFSSAFTHVVLRDDARHDVLRNIDLLNALSGTTVEPGPLELTLDNDAHATARTTLDAAGCKTKAVAICQGSSGWMRFKRWPLRHAMDFAERLLRSDDPPSVVVYCGPEERDEARAWREHFHKKVLLIEGLDICAFAAALSQMSVVVANDSLPMHICAALQVPLVALFGPTDPVQTGPWQSPARVITAKADYAPYYTLPYPLDPAQFPDVMESIDPESVGQAVNELVAQR